VKTIFFIFVPFFLFLLQVSFLPAAFPFSPLPNLLMIFLIVCLILEDPNHDGGFYLALFSGALSDLAHYQFFGFYIIIFFSVAYIVKFILKNYVQISLPGF